MNSVHTRPSVAVTLLWTLVSAAGCAFTIYMIRDSWPRGSWQFDAVLSALLLGCLLARGASIVAACGTAFSLAAAAAVISAFAGWPQEPGPASAIALAVLLGTAMRHGSATVAASTVGAGVAVAALTAALSAQEGPALGPSTVWLVGSFTVALLGAGYLRLSSGPSRRDERGAS